MANYYGTGRSNYVRVTDLKKAEKIAALYGCLVIRNDDRIAFIAKTDDGDVQDYFYPIDQEDVGLYKEVTGTCPEMDDESFEDELLPDFADIVAEILRPNEVFIWIHAGAEKLNYIDGYAVAINSNKERAQITLGSIYDSAFALGSEITMATSCLSTVTKFLPKDSPAKSVDCDQPKTNQISNGEYP